MTELIYAFGIVGSAGPPGAESSGEMGSSLFSSRDETSDENGHFLRIELSFTFVDKAGKLAIRGARSAAGAGAGAGVVGAGTGVEEGAGGRAGGSAR